MYRAWVVAILCITSACEMATACSCRFEDPPPTLQQSYYKSDIGEFTLGKK